MLSSSTSGAIQVLDGVALSVEMLELEIECREGILAPVDLAQTVLFAAELQKQIRAFENALPALPRQAAAATLKRRRGSKRGHDREIDNDVSRNGQKR